MKLEKWKKKKWFAYTVATCAAVVLYMILSHLGDIFSGLNSFFSFLRPVISGIIIAYVINPLANFFEKKVFYKIKKEKTRWSLSTLLALVVLIACIVLLFVALIPQLADSVSVLVSNMDTYVGALQEALSKFENGSNGIFGVDLAALANFGDSILQKISDYFTDNMDSIVGTSANFGKSVADIVIALILAVYFLLGKKRITGNCAKHQRALTVAIKRARHVALMPYVQE